MPQIAISLGWNCYPAIRGVELGLRARKINGYNTCPFDEALTNYDGVVACITNDFSDFFNLSIKDIPLTAKYCTGDSLIWNQSYKFLFNHESPGHANLWSTQQWPGGKYHYISDDYKNFRERYVRRIQHFREYIFSGENIQFLISYPSPNLINLHTALQEQYPDLTYSITRFDPSHINGILHYEEHMQLMQ
jgi:hypothetical protein